MTSINSNISFISFSKLYNWSVQYLLDNEFTYSNDFPLVPIGNFLKRNKTTIEVENGQSYKRVTIKTNNGGVYLRDIEEGENIGTKNQFIISKGQFIVSKIDARNGAFGVVTEEVDGAIITGNFWTYDVDYSIINPHYLALVTTTPEFIKFCEISSTGTTNRHYLQEDLFLKVKIPLPPVNDKDALDRNLPNVITQEKLVSNYNKKLNQAKEAQILAQKTEDEIEVYLLSELGITKNNYLEVKKGLNIFKFSDLIDRWYILEQRNDIIDLMNNSTFPIKSLGYCFNIINRTWKKPFFTSK